MYNKVCNVHVQMKKNGLWSKYQAQKETNLQSPKLLADQTYI